MNKIIILSVLICFSSCATQKRLYHWGSYEALLYDMYVKPSKATPPKQIQVLTRDIEHANSKQLKVAPGIYAHLGMLYAQVGDKPSAIASLKMEKKLFPESTVMIDGLISRAFPGVSLEVEDESSVNDSFEAGVHEGSANEGENNEVD